MKLVYGKAGSGKSFHCMNEIKNELEKNASNTLIYIVPEQYSLGAEFDLSRLFDQQGTIRIQVLSFKRLAYRIFNELGYTKVPFSSSSKNMLLYDILMKHEKDFYLLKDVNKNKGLVDTVSDMLSEMKRYCIQREQLNKFSTNDELLKMKLHDLALADQLLAEKIAANFIDVEDRLTILSQLIPQSTMLKNAKIWIDEFDTFTPQEWEIIQALDKVTSSITVTLTYVPTSSQSEQGLFSISKRTYQKVIDSFSNIDEIYLEQLPRFSNPELYHLAQNIFQYPFKPYQNGVHSIHIHTEENPKTELENVAKTIAKKVREDDIRYENIAILTREIDSYKTIIKRVFEEYHIPYFFDDKKELSMQPLLTLITSLFEILSKNFTYESVFQYLKTGLTNIYDCNDIDLLENYVLQYGIRGYSKWQKEWEYPHDSLEKINIIRKTVVEPIQQFKENLQGKKTVKEIATNLYQFFIQIGINQTIQEKVNSFKQSDSIQSNELELANIYLQVWNIVMNLLDEMVECLGSEMISWEQFKNILLQGVAKHQIGILPTSNDQVMIGDISRTRNSHIKILFIIGVNDGVFPKPFSSEGLINDKERDSLLEQGIELAKNTKLLLLEENFHIYKALTTPSHELYLSYPITNYEGSALRPSTIIYQLKNIFPSIQVQSNILKESNEFYTEKEALNPLLANLRNYYDGKELKEVWKNLYLWYQKNQPEVLNKIQSGFQYKNTIESLDQKHAKKLYGKELYGSVSRLETYVNCPFSYYLRYGLKAKERKIFQLETPDVGLFLHDIIDSFSKYYYERNISLRDVSPEEAEKVISQLTDDTLTGFKNNILNSSQQMKMLSQKLKRVVKRMINIILYHIKSGEFEIEGTEIEFGNHKQFSAVEIELSDGNKLVLSGVIDRIDIAKTEDGKYIRIIDYKSYHKELKLSDIYYGLQLQLLVYMDASLENQKNIGDNDLTTEDELLPGGMLYLKLDDPLFKTKKEIPVEEVEKEIAKKLRMKGVILSDARLLKAMDSQMTTESSVLDLTIKKDGSFSSKVPSASKEQFQMLIQHMKKILKQMGDEILKGNIQNEPVKKKGQTPCEYCSYQLICQFDKELGNQYKIIHDLKNDEVFQQISPHSI